MNEEVFAGAEALTFDDLSPIRVGCTITPEPHSRNRSITGLGRLSPDAATAKPEPGRRRSRNGASAVGAISAVIAKNGREVRSICFEGPAGLLSIIDPDDIARDGYARSTGETSLRLQNGTLYSAFTADRPDNLRGYAFDGAWFDEFSSWPAKSAQNVVDNIWFCLREASQPRVIVTTTPKPVSHIVNLLKRSETDPTVVVTRGSTMDNAPNLS